MSPYTGEISHGHLDFEEGMMPLTEDEVRVLTPLNASNRKAWMKNKPCVCGSAKKFKRCCWSKYQ